MDKIKEAQTLADKLIDECICQVGKNKAALNDEPESVEKSQKDIEKAVKMEESKEVKVSDVPPSKRDLFKLNRTRAAIAGRKLTTDEKSGKKPIVKEDALEEKWLEKDEVNKLHSMRTKLADKYQKQSKNPTLQKINPFSTTRILKQRADRKKKAANWNRKFSKAISGIKEADQIKTAQQKDTLFDKLERVTKDSDKLKPSLPGEPTSEGSVSSKLAMWMRKKVGMSTKADKAKYAAKGKKGSDKNLNKNIASFNKSSNKQEKDL